MKNLPRASGLLGLQSKRTSLQNRRVIGAAIAVIDDHLGNRKFGLVSMGSLKSPRRSLLSRMERWLLPIGVHRKTNLLIAAFCLACYLR